MGQRWPVLNLDKKQVMNERIKVPTQFVLDIGKELYCVLFQARWIPVSKVMDKLKINYKKDYDPRSLGLFGKLPVEVIDMIFLEIDDFKSIFYLACTNTRLMILSEKSLRDAMHIPSWEGDRIICLGSYAKDEDLPEGVISQEYLDFVGALPKPGKEEEEEADWTFVRWAMKKFESVPIQFEKLTWLRCESMDDLCKDLTCAGPEEKIPKNIEIERKMDFNVVRELIRHITNVDDRIFVPHMEVLWNHTKKVYIRLSTALDALEELEVTVYDDYNLMGKFLFQHICWLPPSNPGIGTSISDKGDAQARLRGRWAGDRFEFTVQRVLDSRLESEKGEWKDVSEDAIKVLTEVYKKDYRKDWKEKLSDWEPEFDRYWRRLRPAYHKAT